MADETSSDAQTAGSGTRLPEIDDGGLVQHMATVLGTFQVNRALVEAKWNRNFNMYDRLGHTDPNGPHTIGEANIAVGPAGQPEDLKRSTLYHDIGKQKAVSAQGILSDIRFRGGNSPLMLVDQALPESLQEELAQMREMGADRMPAPAGGEDETTAALRQRALALDENERLLQRQQAACNAIGQDEMTYLFGAVYGVMCQKFFIHERRRTRFDVLAPDAVVPREEAESMPAKQWVTPWQLFWDMNVPFDQSEMVIQVDDIDAFQLRQQLGQPGWIDANIARVLESHDARHSRPKDAQQNTRPAQKPQQQTRQTIRRREAWGRWPRALVERFEAYLAQKTGGGYAGSVDPSGHGAQPAGEAAGGPTAGDEVHCHLITANDILVRFLRIEPGDMPYEVEFFEERLDGVGGLGVMDNLESHQHLINGLVRSISDTAKVVSQFILAGRRRMLNTDFVQLSFGLFLDLDEDAKTAREALEQVVFQGDLDGLMRCLEFCLKLAHFASNIPESQQGLDPTTEQTFQEFQQRLQHAGAYLGSVIRRIDALDERMYSRWLRFNALNPENRVPRGDYRVQSLGFTSFQNRFMRAQSLLAILNLILKSDVLMAMSKIEAVYREVLQAHDLDPAQVIKSAQELMQEAQAQEAQLAAQQAAVAAQGGQATPDQASEIAATQAKIALLQAQARLSSAKADATASQAMIERARAAAELRTPQMSAAPAQVPAPA